MILTVDIGNSNIVLGGVYGEEIVFEARLRTDATKTSDEYCIDLKMILDVYHVDPEQIEGGIIASVVPQVLNSMQTAIKKLTGKTCGLGIQIFFDPACCFDLIEIQFLVHGNTSMMYI